METPSYPEKYWHCYVQRKGKSSPEGIVNDLSFQDISQKIVQPWRDGRAFTVEGVIVRSQDEVEEIRIVRTDQPLQHYIDDHSARMSASGIVDMATNRQMLPFGKDRGTDYTFDLLFSKPPAQPAQVDQKEEPLAMKSFVVHGHDEALLYQVARFIESIGVEAIILMEQPHEGRTLIEKLEQNDVSYAVILCTGDDLGRAKDEPELHPRPRQNVVLELGFFIGALKRRQLCVLKAPGIEMPSDLHGVGYHDIDEGGGWKLMLAKEMKKAGLPIDLNRAIV